MWNYNAASSFHSYINEVDWAKSAGYSKAFSFDSLEDMTSGIDVALTTDGAIFVHLLIEPQIKDTLDYFGPPTGRTAHPVIAEKPEALGKALVLNLSGTTESQTGVK
ncbi:MAG: hypothetical protein VX895_07540 [Chloroflexota bacterium]|nr:hypothetical protein [Chloroflexota bacterium]